MNVLGKPVMDNDEDLLNVIAFEGYVNSEVEFFYDDKKKSNIAKFYVKNPCKIGGNKYGNDFYVVAYTKNADKAKEFSVGTKVSVSGKMSTWSKSDKKGRPQQGVTVIANELHVLRGEPRGEA